MTRTCGAFIVALAGVALSPISASSQEDRGTTIAREAVARDDGFGSIAVDVEMELLTRSGNSSKRDMRIKFLEVPQDGDRILFIFDSPSDVRGTAFLIHGHKDRADDQWLYLPALKRVKRISSANRSGSFVGSEFSYEDLSSEEVDKFDYRFLRTESCGSVQCSVTERRPRDSKSHYSRQEVWRNADDLRLIKVDYFDRRNALFKTLELTDYALYENRYWRAATMTMSNHVSGKSSVMRWSNFDFGAELDQREFSQAGLKRVR